jgi:NADH dehydrogenase
MTTPKIIILGGGYAGVLMAFRVAGKVGKHADITLIDAKPHFVERIRLHQFATQQEVPQRAYTDLFKGKKIQFVQGWVTAINPNHNTVSMRTVTGESTLSYDYLAYALGSATDKTSVPGVAEYAYTVGAEADATKLRTRLAELSQTGGKVVVVGGGLTGIETVTELAETYPSLNIRLVTRGISGEGLSQKGQNYLHQTMATLGITVEENVSVHRVNATALETTRGPIPTDLCVWSGPFRVSPLAQQSGIQVNAHGQITVDRSLRSLSHPTIYAVGDAADLSNATTTPIRMACATAMPMGAYAGSHLVATVKHVATPAPFRFAYAGQCISLGRNRALMQIVDQNDNPTDRIITGRMGAFIKEAICRYTVFGIIQERYLPGSLWYPKPSSTDQKMTPIPSLK